MYEYICMSTYVWVCMYEYMCMGIYVWYICMSIYVWVYMYEYMYEYICMGIMWFICIWVYMYIYMYMSIYVWVCMGIIYEYICMSIWLSMCRYVYVYKRLCVCMGLYINVHVCLLFVSDVIGIFRSLAYAIICALLINMCRKENCHGLCQGEGHSWSAGKLDGPSWPDYCFVFDCIWIYINICVYVYMCDMYIRTTVFFLFDNNRVHCCAESASTFIHAFHHTYART